MSQAVIKPGLGTRVMNVVALFGMRLGLSLAGSRVLVVRGRKTGHPYATPVNPLQLGDQLYLVAPRGQTQWVRNLRATQRCELRLGRKGRHFSARELDGDGKVEILREYLRKWKWESGQFFGGVGASASQDELRRIAPQHPVFQLESDRER